MTEMAIEDLPADIQAKVLRADQDVPRVVDYFATTETSWVTLPDGAQKVEIKVMNEGERRRYLNKTNSEVKMNSRTKDLIMRSAVGDDLHALLETTIVGWDVQRGGAPYPFNSNNLGNALNVWPPTLIDLIAKEVKKINPWMLGTEDDLDVLRDERDELDKRIVELTERAAKSD